LLKQTWRKMKVILCPTDILTLTGFKTNDPKLLWFEFDARSDMFACLFLYLWSAYLSVLPIHFFVPTVLRCSEKRIQGQHSRVANISARTAWTSVFNPVRTLWSALFSRYVALGTKCLWEGVASWARSSAVIQFCSSTSTQVSLIGLLEAMITSILVNRRTEN
jgi:hypothetical protein